MVLPHRWPADGSRRVSYVARVELARAPVAPWALYLPSLNMNAAVHVNGVLAGDGGRMEEPLARHRYRPLWFGVPAPALHAGKNEIVVEVVSQPPGSGFLQQVYLGPAAALEPYFELRHFLKVELPSGVAVAVAGERLARLGAEALSVEWQVADLPADFALERGATLQLMRIVQEAFTNTLKHAGARRFTLHAAQRNGGLVIEISDDGRGFDPAAEAGGYGLSNMRARTQKIGGRLEITSTASGTRMSVRLPAG